MDSKYLIGSLAVLQNLYPDHDFDHARKSLDGSLCVIERPVDADDVSLLESENVLVLTHEEALTVLNSKASENVWYKKIEMPVALIAPPVVEPIPEPDPVIPEPTVEEENP